MHTYSTIPTATTSACLRTRLITARFFFYFFFLVFLFPQAATSARVLELAVIGSSVAESALWSLAWCHPPARQHLSLPLLNFHNGMTSRETTTLTRGSNKIVQHDPDLEKELSRHKAEKRNLCQLQSSLEKLLARNRVPASSRCKFKDQTCNSAWSKLKLARRDK